MEKVIYLSFVTASISFTVTETKIFKAVREWAKRKNSFLGELLSCGYCFGHWVAFALVAIYRPKLFDLWWFLDFFLTALVIAWLGGFQWICQRCPGFYHRYLLNRSANIGIIRYNGFSEKK